MAKLGTIVFPDCILDALRDGELVVFAGAGVSMGPPSNLASFEKLANDIAFGTGQVASDPLDRFLGQLQHRKVSVHERAAQLLSRVGSAPNALHHDLLRLFRVAERVRLVTTNFDQHFQTAAQALFGELPDIHRAPALPLGNRFAGIVHVHGALTHPQDMVLTDADFGRAYLTEGWARRFLVEVFRRYTVLFVGYSHADVAMNYLARALPADSVAGRFALTDEDGSWDLLGIQPIPFQKATGVDAYGELYDGVGRLADRATRGALDWQSRMMLIGERTPPADEETIGEVEQALREVHTTRFLTNVARDAEWPKWLSARKHLDALFGTAELSERDRLLAVWLAEHYAIEHPDQMFDLVATHDLRLNPMFWSSVCRELGLMQAKALEDSALQRWITILLASAPIQADQHALAWLAKRCADQGLVQISLKVFLFMCEHRIKIQPGFVWHDSEDNEHGSRLDLECPLRTDHWTLNEVWTKHLQPHMASVAQPLLSGITRRLEDIHHDFMAWDKVSSESDPLSDGRSCIEHDAQNRYAEAIDVLIDVGRDALVWLAGNAPALLDAWIERLVTSDVPILRRLAIHAITEHPGKSADDRLRWLLDRVGLHGLAEHHEAHRAAALAYPEAGLGARQAVVDAVLAHLLPAIDDRPAEWCSARAHFDWLAWLQQADPDCALIQTTLAPIKAEHPEWQPSDRPDLTHWTSSGNWLGPQSPWTAQELLAKTPGDQLNELLNFRGNRLDGADRDSLISTINEACKQQPSWAFALAEALAARGVWVSDIWPAVMRGWQEAELGVDDWRAVLTMIGKPELQTAHPRDVANLLYSLVRDGGKPFALDLLGQANAIALPAWQALEPNKRDDEITDWLEHALNRPAGIMVNFWIHGLSLSLQGKSGNERTLPDDYRQWFTTVVQESTSKGGLGRSLLASQLAFLFGLDETWARQYLVPLFSADDPNKFSQAWSGFLVWGRLYPELVDALMPAFVEALPRLDADTAGRRRRFIEFYTALAVFHVNDPTLHLLPAFFRHASVEDRMSFASHLGHFLRQMQPAAKQELWDRWLLRYWQDRQQAVPTALDEAEIKQMLGWLPDLDDSFPVAVSLAVRSPQTPIEHSDVLRRLRESDLVTRYPAETAELLIHLCNCVPSYFTHDLGEVAARLPALTHDLKRRLDEALAHAGVNRQPPRGDAAPANKASAKPRGAD